MRYLTLLLGIAQANHIPQQFDEDYTDQVQNLGQFQSQYQFNIKVRQEEPAPIKSEDELGLNKLIDEKTNSLQKSIQNLNATKSDEPIGSDFQIKHATNVTLFPMQYNKEGKEIIRSFNPYSIVQKSYDKKDINSLLTGTLQANLTTFDQYRMIKRDLGQADDIVDIIDPRGIPTGKNNPIIEHVQFQIGQATPTISYLFLDDAKNGRFSPPTLNKPTSVKTMRLDMCGIEVETAPFGFKFADTRNKSNVHIHTEHSNFFMTDKYLQLDLQLPSQRIYGLGERNREFALGEGTWTMWSRDDQSSYDDGTGGKQSMGVHPFALIQTANPGEFFGLFFRNSNAQSPVLKHKKDNESTLSYVTTGGTIEIYFFFKGTAKQIIQQYQKAFGTPTLPPMWALGWHSSASAFKSLSDIEKNVESYKESALPLEGIWLDVSYKDSAGEFLVNEGTFSNLTNFTKAIQADGKRMIVTVDPTLDVQSRGPYYKQAQQDQALIKSSINRDKFNGALTAEVNKRQAVFLDFFNDKAVEIWKKGLKDLFGQVEFDGLWLDTNELRSQCEGECPGYKPKELHDFYDKKGLQPWYRMSEDQSKVSSYNLPFIPGRENLDFMTLSLNATHANGISEYDVHSLHGYQMALKTKEFLEENNSTKRSFVMTKNTFAGSGAYTHHQLGETHRNWENMTNTVAGVMNFNMFGIPLTGPDTCGYISSERTNETEELCARWIQLASFYPFARQHRDENPAGALEPYLMNDLYKNWTRNAMHQRMNYVRHFYTCLYAVSEDGGTCFDPLLFHYPEDDQTFSKIEHSFIFGNALKISPVFDYETSQGQYFESYFPKGQWVSMNNYGDVIDSKGGKDGWKELRVQKTSDALIQSHLMPGAIVLKQEGTFNTTQDLNLTLAPLTLVANRDSNGHASGLAYLDDGETIDGDYEYYQFDLSAKSIKKWQKDNGKFNGTFGQLDEFVITNAIDLNDTDFACMTTMTERKFIGLNVTYDEIKNVISLKANNAKDQPQTIDLRELKDIHFGNSKREINYCNIGSQGYHVKAEQIIDLSKAQTTIVLENDVPHLEELNLTLSLLSTGVININYNFASTKVKPAFEVPKDIVNPNKDSLSSLPLSDFVKINQPDKDTSITIRNSKATDVYTLKSFILGQYYNQIESVAHTAESSKGIMGLFGRQTTNLFLEDGVYGGWSHDIANQAENFTSPNQNSYGNHPVYFGKDQDGTWFGVYTNLVAAQDWYIENFETGEVSVKTVAAGGIGDIYIMLGKNPNKVTKLYHSVIGKPVLTPQWALGWHQSRWGNQNTDMLQENVDQYAKNNLPLDTVWSDIDYMSNYRSFTYDKKHFGDLPHFVHKLHENNLHYIPIIDAGIAQRDSSDYDAYNSGLKENVFIKNQDGSLMQGRVWANDAVFPDFFHSNTSSWWGKQLSTFHNEIGFDGIWLDMNEASNFCDGQCYQASHAEKLVHQQLPYVPTERNLQHGSLPLEAVHGDEGKIFELDAHSLWGTMEAKASSDWFVSKQKRPMIIERSASPGVGKYASQWLGDNYSKQFSLSQSMTGIMANNIAGIPLSGADICGFIGDTDPELCARWHVVGAFYPFSRNHNDVHAKSQEPYAFAGQVYEGKKTYLDIMRKAMRTKYHLSKYYQSELSFLHEEGGAFYKPLFFEFPDDPRSYNDQHMNVMLGSGLKLAVQTNSTSQKTSNFYFPPGTWCDVFNPANGCTQSSIGQLKELPSKADDFYLHIRAGYIVPMQNATHLNINNTAELQKEPIDIHINPLCLTECKAAGKYLNDDGETLDIEGLQNVYTFKYSQAGADEDLQIDVNMTRMATGLQKGRENDNFHINQNDALGRIEIYNAKATGNNFNYTVTVGYHTNVQNPVIHFADAIYDPDLDRVVWSPGEDFWLPQLASITLTKVNKKYNVKYND